MQQPMILVLLDLTQHFLVPGLTITAKGGGGGNDPNPYPGGSGGGAGTGGGGAATQPSQNPGIPAIFLGNAGGGGSYPGYGIGGGGGAGGGDCKMLLPIVWLVEVLQEQDHQHGHGCQQVLEITVILLVVVEEVLI